MLNEKNESMLERFSRRVSRVATLDGGSVVTDSGYSDTDRTLTIEADVTEVQKALLEYMIKNYSLWNVVTGSGHFVCSPKSMNVDNGELRLILYITE